MQKHKVDSDELDPGPPLPGAWERLDVYLASEVEALIDAARKVCADNYREDDPDFWQALDELKQLLPSLGRK